MYQVESQRAVGIGMISGGDEAQYGNIGGRKYWLCKYVDLVLLEIVIF